MIRRSSRWGSLIGAVSIFAGVLVQGVTAGATQVQLKPSVDLGSIDFNLALDLSGITSRVATLGALNCTDGSATYGSLFEMEIALAMDPRLRSSINLTCRPVVNISGAVQAVTGTMTIPSKGVTDGVLTAKCSAKSGITVVATAVVGAGVPGLLQLNVSSSSGPVPYGCDFTGTCAEGFVHRHNFQQREEGFEVSGTRCRRHGKHYLFDRSSQSHRQDARVSQARLCAPKGQTHCNLQRHHGCIASAKRNDRTGDLASRSSGVRLACEPIC